jgi:hypothetical protein
MNPRPHETKSHPPVEGLTVCAAHEESMGRVFDKIDEAEKTLNGVINTKMSKGQVMWAVGILISVAAFYGVTLWQNTTSAADKNAQNIMEIDKRVLTLEVQWKGVQAQLDRIEAEQKAARTEQASRFDAIHKALQENKKP